MKSIHSVLYGIFIFLIFNSACAVNITTCPPINSITSIQLTTGCLYKSASPPGDWSYLDPNKTCKPIGSFGMGEVSYYKNIGSAAFCTYYFKDSALGTGLRSTGAPIYNLPQIGCNNGGGSWRDPNQQFEYNLVCSAK